MFILGMHDWPLYTGKPIWREAFIVAADRVRQGPLYRGSLYSEKRRESKILAVMGRWPFYRGDRWGRFNCTWKFIKRTKNVAECVENIKSYLTVKTKWKSGIKLKSYDVANTAWEIHLHVAFLAKINLLAEKWWRHTQQNNRNIP